MLPYTRNRLSPEVIEATLVSKSFLRGYLWTVFSLRHCPAIKNKNLGLE
jgi:hypothetical protein